MKTSRSIPVALYEEECGKYSAWIARCLDLDLVAQGQTMDEAKANFVRILKTHINLSLEAGVVPFRLPTLHAAGAKAKQSVVKLSDYVRNVKVAYSRLGEPVVEAIG